MRWIKHMTAARSDKAMALVSEQHGPVAIGIYWGIVEDIAGPMEPGKMTPSASHSVAKWASILDTSTRTFTKICKSLQTESLIFCETIEDRLTISIPNILKYKDEYARKSGQTQEQEQKQSRADTEQIQKTPDAVQAAPADGLLFDTGPEIPKRATRKDRKPFEEMSVEQRSWFNYFWATYPRRESDKSKNVAITFIDWIKTPEIWERAKYALDNKLGFNKDPHFQDGAAKWLNAEPWQYDMPTNGNGHSNGTSVKPKLPFHVAPRKDPNAIPIYFGSKPEGVKP